MKPIVFALLLGWRNAFAFTFVRTVNTRPSSECRSKFWDEVALLEVHEVPELEDDTKFARYRQNYKGLYNEMREFHPSDLEPDIDDILDEDDPYFADEYLVEDIVADEEDEYEYIGEPFELEFTDEEFAEALSKMDYNFERDKIVKGVARAYDRGGVLLDIGAKAEALLPPEEFRLIPVPGLVAEDIVSLGEEIEVQIISDDDSRGRMKVSIKSMETTAAWHDVAKLREQDSIFEAKVVGINRGGAICLVNGLRAFLPGSHMSGVVPTEEMIGNTLKLKMLDFNPEEGKIVVSNRLAIVEQQMKVISRGDIVNGFVKAIKPYGVFVDVNGMSGLLHISQVSYDRIEDLEDHFTIDMPVKCMIIDHDRTNGRVALSTKTLEAEPGAMLRDPQSVFDRAEETGQRYHEKMEKERRIREETARDIVLGLGDSLEDLGMVTGSRKDSGSENLSSDPLADITDSLDSLLSS